MLGLFFLHQLDARAAQAPPRKDYLSPTALVATDDGKTLFIACATADRVLVFDTASERIETEIPVPAPPLGLALSPDKQRLFVTCAAPESTVCIIDVAKQKVIRKIPAGHTAMAPVVSPDGKTLFVCNRFNNSVTVFDLAKCKALFATQVPREPVAAALTPDGRRLLVANHIHAGRSDGDFVASSVSVIDAISGAKIKDMVLPNGSTLLRGVAISPDGKFAAVTHLLARFHLPTTQIERGWINNNALSLIDVEKCELLNTVLLDNIDSGAGNPWAVEWTRDGKSICVTHAGTHEVTIVNAAAVLEKLQKLANGPEAVKSGGYSSVVSRTAADVPNDLAFLVGLKRRISLNGGPGVSPVSLPSSERVAKGPRGIALTGNKIYTANYFSDSLSVMETGIAEPVARTISLGGPKTRSVVRQGELNWNDAALCFQGWHSCSSCHSSDARVDGMNWDNLNDGIGNPKNAKSMLFAHQTPPSMALGVRANAEAAVRAGIKNSLFVVLPEASAVALDEYLKSLRPVPSPHLVNGKLSASAQRGKKLFSSEKAGCADCHKGRLLTDMKFHDVGTISAHDHPTNRFDTPTLVEVWRSAPYLHDGSAATVKDVLTTRNLQGKHGGGTSLTRQEIDDLAAFVLSQ